MNKYVRISLVLLSVVLAILAWRWVYDLQPESPLVPFVLMFMSGANFRQALED